MKANELRIGNWVIISTPFCMDYDAMHDTYIDDDWDELIPIPLTEEWLLKFGFNNSEGQFTMPLRDDNLTYLEIYLYEHSVHSFNIYEDDCGEINCISLYYKIEYVHQLQNLYFSLTGKDLV